MPTPVSDGLIAWWSGDGNANDLVGARNGTGNGALQYVPGISGQAFKISLVGGQWAKVSVPDDEVFKLTSSLTISAWVNLASYLPGLIFFRGDNRPGLDAYALSVDPAGAVGFHVGNEANEYTQIVAPIPLAIWKHVVAILDGATGDLKLYLDGALAAQTNTTVRPLRELDANWEPALGIGNHGGSFHVFPIEGKIDEVALYGRALTDAEVQATYQSSAGGGLPLQPPIILEQPQSRTVLPGRPASFTVSARGSAPLTYQWVYNETETLTGANSATLELLDVQTSQAGNYAVIVANPAGVVTSTIAVLTVCLAPPTPVAEGLIALWSAEGNADDLAGGRHGLANSAVMFTPGVQGQAFQITQSNGVWGRINVPDDDAFKLTNSLSIAAWVNIQYFLPGFILFRGDNRPGFDPYVMYVDSEGRIGFQIQNEANDYTRIVTPIPLATWKHVVAVLDGSTGDLKLYVDGALGAQTNTAMRPFANLDPQHEPALGIGNHGGTFHVFPIEGEIDELALYGRALLESEIQALYLAGTGSTNNTPRPPLIQASATALRGPQLGLELVAPVFAGFADRQCRLTITARAGRSYGLEASSNLIDWITVTNFANFKGSATLLDAEATLWPVRFYRLRINE